MTEATSLPNSAPYRTHSDVLDRPQAQHVTSVAFIYLLLATTFVFYIAAPFVHRYVANLDITENPGTIWRYVMYSATMHVALTGIFYLDPAMFPLMSQNRLRFLIVAPLVLVGVLWLWIFASPRILAYYWCVYMAWTYWHFQKQHWGVYSFIRIHEKSRPQMFDRAIVLYGGYLPAALIWVAWIISTQPQYFWFPVTVAAASLVRFAGPLVCVSLAMAAYAIVQEYRAARAAARPIAVLSLVLLAFLSCNNWPFLFFGTGSLATSMVNTGHGLQYIVFMTVFAYDRNRVYRLLNSESAGRSVGAAVSNRIDARWLGPVIGLLYIAIMFLGAAWAYHGRASRLLAAHFSIGSSLSHAHLVRLGDGLGYAITIVHYILDASAWKLSKPEARAVMVQKYNFLLGRRASPAAAA
jgi:hypothetical protein